MGSFGVLLLLTGHLCNLSEETCVTRSKLEYLVTILKTKPMLDGAIMASSLLLRSHHWSPRINF